MLRSIEIITSGKWFELLKQLAPRVSRVLLLFRSNTPETTLRLPTVEAVAASFEMTIKLASVSDRIGIVGAIEAFEQGSDIGMIDAKPDNSRSPQRDHYFGGRASHP